MIEPGQEREWVLWMAFLGKFTIVSIYFDDIWNVEYPSGDGGVYTTNRILRYSKLTKASFFDKLYLTLKQ